MKLTFRLRFHTENGQSLFLSGSHPALGEGSVERVVALHYLDPDHWQATVEIPDDMEDGALGGYHYFLRNADGSLVHDWGAGRRLPLSEFRGGELLVVDSWNYPGFYANAFDTEPFQRVLLKVGSPEVRPASVPGATHTFCVRAPLLSSGETLCLVGGTAALGNWNTAQPILLTREGNAFSVRLDLNGQSFPFAYKYGVYDAERRVFICFEGGNNRLAHDTLAPGRHTLVDDGFAVLPADTWRGAGVAIPVFSLRTENSFGAGEFTDLKLLADWAARVGLKLIQLLPINDTTATHTVSDSYPYAAISAFALHPLYLNLGELATGRNQALLKKLEPERRRLNALEDVDYEAVMRAKLDFIGRIFPSQKDETFSSADYREFFEHNQHWLIPYAAFCHLRDEYKTSDFNQWPVHQKFDGGEIAGLSAKASPAHDAISLHYFIQFHLHRQLRDAASYARERGIVVKGDIAIGVHRCGADTWQNPGLFHLDKQAGAPPDAFATKGQNWSFPTYNWPRMKEDGFAWWKQRFQQMSHYFDAFRIDHILGFFRIWSIPTHAVEGILGYFVPALPVQAAEFEGRGIVFDRERFTRPFITDAVLAEVFGGDAEGVKQEFLLRGQDGHYSLKPEIATQRQMEKHLAGLEQTEVNRRIKQGLYDLISNVILLEEEGAGGEGFHFRFAMEDTSSFKELPPRTQTVLKELYHDYFFHRQEDLWTREAMEKLPALKAVTNMLMCGEDLGMVPDCVPGVMKQLGLLCLEVQRMPKRAAQEFSRPAEAPYLSVVTPSTHDMSTVRGWWEEDRTVTGKFFARELGGLGDAPLRCDPWINRAIILQHLESPAMWSIFQLQDLLGMEERLRRADPAAERINVPAIADHHWRYRMHLTLEALMQADAFNRDLNRCVVLSGR